MNRAERRMFKKKLGKKLEPIANDIIELHKQYEGKDDQKLEQAIEDRIRGLSFEQLMLLMEYIDNNIDAANS
jgi:hypothetical protein